MKPIKWAACTIAAHKKYLDRYLQTCNEQSRQLSFPFNEPPQRKHDEATQR